MHVAVCRFELKTSEHIRWNQTMFRLLMIVPTRLTCSVWSWPRLNFVRFSFPMAKFLPGSGYHDEEWHHQGRHQTSTINPSHLHTHCRQGFCLCSFPFIVQCHRGAGLSVGLHLSKSQRRNPHKLNPLVYTLHCCCWSRNVNQTLVWHRLIH